MNKNEKKVSITLSYSTLKLFAVLVVGLVIGFAMGNAGTGPDSGNAAAPQQQQAAPQDAGSGKVSVSADDDPVLGNKDAPVTVIEFSDFECPFCGRAFTDAVTGMKKDYVETGKVKFVYRDFPLSFHPQATPAAEAAECADEQGKFWEFHDTLFQNQGSLSDAFYKQTAADLGLDTAKFNSCVESRKYRAEVQQDLAAGSAAGVSGTPTFYIGNDKDGYTELVGAQPYAVLRQAIEAALAA